MSRILCCLLSLLSLTTGYSRLSAQTIINHYAAVLDYRHCDNIIRVDTATAFQVGDTVLMVQMKGAVIDSSNSAGFGTILDYRGAGNYEYNIIEAKNGNNLNLRYTVKRVYNIPDGKVQLIRVPSYQDYTINQPHSCMPWNGSKGGVFVIHVAGTLTMNQDIDVSGKGFRGATNNQSPTQMGPLICSNTNYYMQPSFDSGSMKGEGIAEVSPDRSYGRGRLGNGGGGGNAFNAGGGGGSNGNAGGTGGSEYRGCNTMSTNNITGGIGGYPLAYSTTANKIFMGGGGGSAQANNLTIATGGNGGGICIITAGSVQGNSRTIKTNGAHALECVFSGAFGSCHDGMGGGGAGGTLLMNTDTVSSLLHTQLTGGKGGNVSGISPANEVGPGGGGGGGILWTKPVTAFTNLVANTNGGLNGIVQYNSSAWGAQPGQSGQMLTHLSFPFPTDSFAQDQILADFSDSLINCLTRHFTDNRATITPGIASRLWLFPGQDTASLQYTAYTFPGYGTYPVTLIVNGVNGCTDSLTQDISIPYLHFADAGKDTAICIGKATTLRASGGLVYSWAPVSGIDSPGIAAPVAAPAKTTSYTVTVTNTLGCIDSDSVELVLLPNPEVTITTMAGMETTCIHPQLQLFAQGAVSYTWSPGIFCNDSTLAAPVVTPPATTLFSVMGRDVNGCADSAAISVVAVIGKTRIFMPNAFSPGHDGLNDDIKPIGLCNFELERFAVYNRLGQKIFASATAEKGWDGTYNGKQADIGTYFYMVTGKNEHRESLVLKGSFILLR